MTNKLKAVKKLFNIKNKDTFFSFLDVLNTPEDQFLKSFSDDLFCSIKTIDINEIKILLKSHHKVSTEDNARKILKTLNKKIDLFWAFQNLQDNAIEVRLQMLQQIIKTDKKQLVELETSGILREIELLKEGDQKFKNLLEYYKIIHPFFASVNRKEDTYIFKLEEINEKYFLYQKLKNACELINRKNIFLMEYDHSSIEKMLPYFILRIEKNPILYVFYRLFQLILHPTHDNYISIKELLSLNTDQIDPEELKDIYSYLQNYCIAQINQGEPFYRNELFQLYEHQLTNKLYQTTGRFPVYDFKNMVTLGIQLNKLAWVEEFTNQYKIFLPKEYQESAVGFNMARIYFIQKEYRKALQALPKKDLADIYYELGARTLILRIYYEQDDLPLLDSVASTFKTFLFRNKLITKTQSESYLNFISFLTKLSRNGDKTAKLKAILIKLIQETKVAEKDWLIEKYEAII